MQKQQQSTEFREWIDNYHDLHEFPIGDKIWTNCGFCHCSKAHAYLERCFEMWEKEEPYTCEFVIFVEFWIFSKKHPNTPIKTPFQFQMVFILWEQRGELLEMANKYCKDPPNKYGHLPLQSQNAKIVQTSRRQIPHTFPIQLFLSPEVVISFISRDCSEIYGQKKILCVRAGRDQHSTKHSRRSHEKKNQNPV